METCPYLGLLEDPLTSAIFPSEKNCCYHIKPVRIVLPTHQVAFCLSNNHLNCPIFDGTKSISGDDFLINLPSRSKPNLILRFTLIIFSGLVFVILGWYIRETNISANSAPGISIVVSAMPQEGAMRETPVASAVNIPDEVLESTTTPLATSEVEYQVVPTLVVDLPPGIETPVSVDPILIVHKVVQGESLAAIANRYQTSPEAIQSINFNLPVPLWENWLIVIPYNNLSASDMPSFEVFWVSSPGLTMDTIAGIFDVDVSLLLQYNKLSLGNEILTDRWILIPHNTP